MLGYQPAFELLPLAQALARHCVLLRSPDGAHQHRLIGVLADPFDLDLQTWLSSRAKASVRQPLGVLFSLAIRYSGVSE